MRIFKALTRRLSWLYGLYVRRDPFLREVRRWLKNGGDQTLRLEYPLTSESLVVDVGGYRGDFADEILSRFGCRVLIFEPVLAFYDECGIRFFGSPKVQIFNWGLGAEDAVLPMELQNDGSHFTQDLRSGATVCSRLRRVDEVLDELGIEQIDLMKINIEGGEYDLLDRLIESGWIHRVHYLQVQFHNFVPDARDRREDVRNRLLETHSEMWNYEFVWESWMLKKQYPDT